MNEKVKAQQSETELQREAFQGIKGRTPQTDRELRRVAFYSRGQSRHRVSAFVWYSMGRGALVN